MHLAPGSERFDQAPFGAGQVLEPVGEHRRARPRAEIGREPLHCPASNHSPIAHVEPRELGPIRRCEQRQVRVEIFGLEQARLDLCQSCGKSVREAGESRRLPQGLELHRADDAAKHDRALRLAEHSGCRPVAGNVLEQRIERPDRPGEQRSTTSRELALHSIDVDPVRDDQPRIPVEGTQEPLEQKSNLAGVCRPDDEREPHLSIVVGGFPSTSLRAPGVLAKSGKRGCGPGRS